MSWLGRSWLLLSAAAALAACAAGSTTPAGDGGGSEGIYLPDSRKQPDGFVPQPDTLQPDSPPGLSISVTAPAAASSHAAGAQLAVTWTSSGPITQVAVELWRAGAKVADIAAAQPPSGGTNWTIDGATPGGSDYVVKVRDTASAAEGVSGQFTIVNWAWRSGVDINGAALTASKSDYPVLVTLTPTTIDYARTAAGGADLRFSTQSALSGTFDVPHYIESWNAGGTSKVWVRVKSVPQGQVTTIYMFYGNAGAQSTSSESAVFVNDFVSSGNLTLTGNKTYDRFTLRGGDTLTIQAGAPLSITARSIVIAGTIDGDFAGYAGGAANSAGNGPGGGGTSTNGGAGGGGYGGKGGLGGRDSSDTPGSGGPANGSTTSVAIDMGSSGGGASAVLGGAGGGAITLAAPDLTVSGAIHLRGEQGKESSRCGGGGAGGGALLVGDVVTFSGTIIANGGRGGDGASSANDGGGGGGGGRIKIFYGTSVGGNGSTQVSPGLGGDGGDTAKGQPGVTGTVNQSQRAFPDVTVTVQSATAL